MGLDKNEQSVEYVQGRRSQILHRLEKFIEKLFILSSQPLSLKKFHRLGLPDIVHNSRCLEPAENLATQAFLEKQTPYSLPIMWQLPYVRNLLLLRPHWPLSEYGLSLSVFF